MCIGYLPVGRLPLYSATVQGEVAGVHASKEEHDLKNGNNSHQASRQCTQMALKAGAKLMITLIIVLCAIEQGKKSGERVRKQGGKKMVFKDL